MPTPYTRELTPSSDSREERLLDDAIDDTFPASDPVSHGQPGSTVGTRYAALEHGAFGQARDTTAWWLLAGAAIAFGVALLMGRNRRS